MRALMYIKKYEKTLRREDFQNPRYGAESSLRIRLRASGVIPK